MGSISTDAAAAARKRALFFCNLPPPYTGQTIGTALTRDLLAEHLQIEVLDTSDGAFNMGRGWRAQLARGRNLVRRVRELKRRLDASRFDIFYFVASSSVAGRLRDVYALGAARPRVRRVVAHVRSGDFHRLLADRRMTPLSRRLVERVDTFIFLSRGLAERSAPYLPEGSWTVVPNPIDEPVRLDAEEAAAAIERRRGRESLRVLYLSNMIPSKGYLDLAAALARLAAGGPAFHADFVGGFLRDEDRQNLERFLRQHRLSDRVTLHGAVSDRARVRQLLVAADAFVLPTYYPVEAQPRSIIEAMNAGTPIVATAHSSIPDYVRDDDNGYLVPARAPAEIADRLARLADLDTWIRLARRARAVYEETFLPSLIEARLVAAVVGDHPVRGEETR